MPQSPLSSGPGPPEAPGVVAAERRPISAALSSQRTQPAHAVGAASDTSDMTTLDYGEFKECIARVGVDKYKSVKAMSEADAIKGFIQNLLHSSPILLFCSSNIRRSKAALNQRWANKSRLFLFCISANRGCRSHISRIAREKRFGIAIC